MRRAYIKIVIAESEIFAIHHDNLVARPGDFGRDFLGRVLPACLFQSVDYVQALREHRRYMAEMKPLYAKYDVLLTPEGAARVSPDAHVDYRIFGVVPLEISVEVFERVRRSRPSPSPRRRVPMIVTAAKRKPELPASATP